MPTGATGRFCPWMRSTATSATWSVPTSSATKSRPSGRVTLICSAFRTTWSLVRMIPSSRTMTPEPKPMALRWAPGGMKKLSHMLRGRAASREMTLTLTTAGATRLAAWTMAVRREASTDWDAWGA